MSVSCPDMNATTTTYEPARHPSAPWLITHYRPTRRPSAYLPHVARMDAIASAYASAPEFEAGAIDAWDELARDSIARADVLRGRFDISETDDPEPYPDAPAMFADLRRGRFTVSRANSAHPLWTVAENVAFRIVHDISGHFVSGGSFDWQGENQACGAHDALLSPLARRALFTECIAQTAFCNAFGYFGPQKVALLDCDRVAVIA